MIENINMDEIINSEMVAKELKVISTNLNKMTKEFNEAEFRCHKLRQFRQEYIDRYNSEMKQYVDEDGHRGFKSFFARLDVVIYEQQEIVESLRRQIKIQRQLWQECKQKELSVQWLSEQPENFALVS
ncbi:MAG TPA: flagellar FliJ family protein [Methylophilus sp.]|nr:flagellar FliJ family protein [Methylophilus sp.]HQQ33751.1 flagellar FliJ family protein [Methylophilus sp.]